MEENKRIYEILEEMLESGKISREEEMEIRGLFQERENKRAEIRIAYDLLNLLQKKVRNETSPSRVAWSQYGLDIPDNFGMILCQARIQAGLTQQQLADITGMHQGDISRIERGFSEPSLATIKRLADGLGMNLNIDFV